MGASRWTAQAIPDQSGRVAIVTGASSGIGVPTASRLAERNARVILAVRNAAKGERAAARIRKSAPTANLRVEVLDLADLKSVWTFADRILASERRLDLLINNAGVMFPPPDRTQDGFEPQFGTNHLGHFALTGLLAPLLHATDRSRVVAVSSVAHMAARLDFDDLNWERRKPTYVAYSDSKIANLLFVLELNRRLAREGRSTIALSAHPGWAQSDLNRNTPLIGLMHGLLAQSEDKGALPTLRAACDPAAKADDYYGPSGFKEMRGWPKLVEPNPAAKSVEDAERLWAASEAMTGVRY